jgi:hypothetical protein
MKVDKRYVVTRGVMDGSRGIEFGRDVIARIMKEESK